MFVAKSVVLGQVCESELKLFTQALPPSHLVPLGKELLLERQVLGDRLYDQVGRSKGSVRARILYQRKLEILLRGTKLGFVFINKSFLL